MFVLENYTSLIIGTAFNNLEWNYVLISLQFHVVNTICLIYGVLTSKTCLSQLEMENAVPLLVIFVDNINAAH